ncbi:putative Glycosyl transferase group 1 [Desulfamplus magnetovallimortis]|uniref:Putative Glycosyl transferase group 1 n=1 Tax=Desulfamplus magnetovallimortis TaxID=1246637 RepID=A0A1W1HEZ2_9BACT|nr:glycosyltransferase [Desulfamplus magnetovallimortis]SLM30968.1 putative Glycosyl transferase group 1 [Desulfamplus magnetovallimortis]
MTNTLYSDKYSNGIRILFIGRGESSHCTSFVDLLDDTDFNVKFFSMNTGTPPDDWKVRTYITNDSQLRGLLPGTREYLYPKNAFGKKLKKFQSSFGKLGSSNIAGRWLAKIIKQWRPHMIQTIGIRYAAYFLHHVRQNFDVEHIGKWIIQDWGPDLTMDRHIEPFREKIPQIIEKCDGYITDNDYNIEIALSLGLKKEKLPATGPILASGGVETDIWKKYVSTPMPSQREKAILWPKAYNCPQSIAYPVFEALKLCWDKISPCHIYMTAMTQQEVQMWFEVLPEKIRHNTTAMERIKRDDFLKLLGKVRVMLAPSLSDGMPNVLAEAMAMGTMPIVSPLSSILPHVDSNHILFARNMFPNEISEALIKAMNDKQLIDSSANINSSIIAKTMGRDKAKQDIINFYYNIHGSRKPQSKE